MFDYHYSEEKPLEKHPMEEYMSGLWCKDGGCTKKDMLISDAGYSVHPHSGDAYGSYMVQCVKCNKKERKTFADN
jgi:hypothetical protein